MISSSSDIYNREVKKKLTEEIVGSYRSDYTDSQIQCKCMFDSMSEGFKY